MKPVPFALGAISSGFAAINHATSDIDAIAGGHVERLLFRLAGQLVRRSQPLDFLDRGAVLRGWA